MNIYLVSRTDEHNNYDYLAWASLVVYAENEEKAKDTFDTHTLGDNKIMQDDLSEYSGTRYLSGEKDLPHWYLDRNQLKVVYLGSNPEVTESGVVLGYNWGS